MATLYPDTTATQAGTDGSTTVDLDTAAPGGTLATQNVNDTAFADTQVWTRTVDDTVFDSGSGSWSAALSIASFTGTVEGRFRIERLNSSGVSQAQSSWSATFTTTGVKTLSETWNPGTWATGDRCIIRFQIRRTGGHGNVSSTVNVTTASNVVGPTAPSLPVTFTGSTTAASSTGSGTGHLYLDDTNGTIATTTDKAALTPAGSLEVIACVEAVDWEGATSPGWVINKHGNSGVSSREYAFGFSSTSLLQFGVSDSTTTYFPTASNSVQTETGVADNSHLWLRGVADVANDSYTFFWSLDPIDTAPLSVSWTAWTGNPKTVGATFNFIDRASALEIGRYDSNNSGLWHGNVYYVGVWDGGTAGTKIAETDWRAGDVTSDGLGNTWTKAGNAVYVAGSTATITVTPASGVTFSGATTAASTTGTATLAVDKNLTGSTTATSTTGAASATVTNNLTGSTTAASTTGDAAISLVRPFTGSTTAASTTGTASATVTNNLTGSTTAASTAGAATLAVDKNLTGSTTAASTAGDATLTVVVPAVTFTGTTVAASTTGTASATVAHSFTGTTTAASTTGTASATVTNNLTGSTTAASTTGDATISRVAAFTGTTTAASTTGDATLTGITNLTGSASCVSTAGTASLAVAHTLTGSTVGNSVSGNATLGLAHAFTGTTTATSTVAGGDLTVPVTWERVYNVSGFSSSGANLTAAITDALVTSGDTSPLDFDETAVTAVTLSFDLRISGGGNDLFDGGTDTIRLETSTSTLLATFGTVAAQIGIGNNNTVSVTMTDSAPSQSASVTDWEDSRLANSGAALLWAIYNQQQGPDNRLLDFGAAGTMTVAIQYIALPLGVQFTGSTTATSTTGAATLVADKNLTGSSIAASTTGAATLGVTHPFTGTTTAASTAGDATLSRATTLTGTTTAASTAGAGTLTTAKTFTGSTTAASSTSGGTIDITGSVTFTGTTTAASTAGAGTLGVTHTFTGTTTAASSTSGGTINTVGTVTFTGATVGNSVSGNATLALAHAFTGSTTAASSTSGATIDTAGKIAFTGTSTASSTAGPATLVAAHSLSGSTSTASTAGDATITRGVGLTGSSTPSSATGTGALVLTVNLGGSSVTTAVLGDGTVVMTHYLGGGTVAVSVAGPGTMTALSPSVVVPSVELSVGTGRVAFTSPPDLVEFPAPSLVEFAGPDYTELEA